MERRIWLIGGTGESAQLAIALSQAHLPCVVTVTTEAARSLYPDVSTLQIWVGRLNADELRAFVLKHNIGAILDASHPYAVEISQLAIATANQLQIPYLRYERPVLEKAAREHSHNAGYEQKDLRFDGFEALLATDILKHQRVLLTVGYTSLNRFSSWQEQATLYARILPSTAALTAAVAAGFSSSRLIAMRPPISAAFERALWQQWQISMVVTKESGAAGGEDIKRSVAAELGVILVTIARPSVDYPQQTGNLTVAVEFCRQNM